MKKLIYVLIAVFALTSCREDPDLGDLSSDFLVFTNSTARRISTVSPVIICPTA